MRAMSFFMVYSVATVNLSIRIRFLAPHAYRIDFSVLAVLFISFIKNYATLYVRLDFARINSCY